MDLRINFSSGVPIYLQLMEQIKHAVDTGAIRGGEQLPTIRKIAEELTMNPNTVAKAYRELEREGVIDVRHGSGAYVAEPKTSSTKSAAIQKAAEALRQAIETGRTLGLSESELRRVFENEVSRLLDVATAARRRT
ncbi:MAG TPA: GntR family transcriptional regulator [Bryobacteraceae bacterium]|nr:GntR family transcriptional regulator [Bryobacteraceae bacterium]